MNDDNNTWNLLSHFWEAIKVLVLYAVFGNI